MASWSLTERLKEKVSGYDPYGNPVSASSRSSLSEKFNESAVRYSASNADIMLQTVRKPVLEATSDEPGGPTEFLLAWIAKMTYIPDKDGAVFRLIMMELATKLQTAVVEKKKWGPPYKALVVLLHILVHGSQEVAVYWTNQDRLSLIQQMCQFEYKQDDYYGRGVRAKATNVLELLINGEKLEEARAQIQLTGIPEPVQYPVRPLPQIPSAPLAPEYAQVERVNRPGPRPPLTLRTRSASLFAGSAAQFQRELGEKLKKNKPRQPREEMYAEILPEVKTQDVATNTRDSSLIKCPVCLAEDKQAIARTLVALRCGNLYCEGCVDHLNGVCAMCRCNFKEAVKLFL